MCNTKTYSFRKVFFFPKGSYFRVLKGDKYVSSLCHMVMGKGQQKTQNIRKGSWVFQPK